MNLLGLAGGQYRPLTQDQIETIHNASLSILEKTGFAYESGLDDTLQLLADNGAAVDSKAKRIRFDRDMIMENAKKANEQVILYSRDGKHDLDLTEERVHMGTG